jgi:hypothetical protein
MRHLKTYENQSETYPYKWENIIQKGDKLYVNLYELVTEMESTAFGKKEMRKMEKIYRKLIKNLLIGKVISFDCEDCQDHIGICDDVMFSADDVYDYSGFDIQYIHILTEDMNDSHTSEDGKITIHLDINPDFFRDTKNYNL